MDLGIFPRRTARGEPAPGRRLGGSRWEESGGAAVDEYVDSSVGYWQSLVGRLEPHTQVQAADTRPRHGIDADDLRTGTELPGMPVGATTLWVERLSAKRKG